MPLIWRSMIPEDTLLFVEPHPPCGSPTTELLHATDPASASSGTPDWDFREVTRRQAWKKCADNTGNHLEGIGREARRAHPVVRQNSQVKLT
jgi:hypothetical protein